MGQFWSAELLKLAHSVMGLALINFELIKTCGDES